MEAVRSSHTVNGVWGRWQVPVDHCWVDVLQKRPIELTKGLDTGYGAVVVSIVSSPRTCHISNVEGTMGTQLGMACAHAYMPP